MSTNCKYVIKRPEWIPIFISTWKLLVSRNIDHYFFVPIHTQWDFFEFKHSTHSGKPMQKYLPLMSCFFRFFKVLAWWILKPNSSTTDFTIGSVELCHKYKASEHFTLINQPSHILLHTDEIKPNIMVHNSKLYRSIQRFSFQVKYRVEKANILLNYKILHFKSFRSIILTP